MRRLGVCAAVALPAFAAALLGAAAPARAGGVATFAVIVGVNRSVDPQMPVLRYADDDAIRYEELFRSLGGSTVLLTRGDDNTRRLAADVLARAQEPRREALGRAMAAVAAGVAAARARGQRTAFYFIYAGHGSVSGGDAYLALEDARLGLHDVEHDIVDRAGADETHLIVDACHSYFLAYGRGPGGSRREIHGFAPVEGLARRADVGLLLSTTSVRESHEWEGFQAGVFSHEVRSGLFGAADFDGDGRVSYGEMAAFVNRANAAIPNERFRPDVFAHPPARSAPLVDLRGGTGRHLRVDGEAQAGRYSLEDWRGVRLADFYNAHGHGVSLLLPAGSGLLYLRRPGDGREFEIPIAPDVISLAELLPREPRSIARGAAHDAFSLIFSLPFDDGAFAPAASAGADLTAAAGDDGVPGARRPAWRTVGGVASLGVAALSLASAATLTVSAHTLAGEARSAPSQSQARGFNDRVTARNDWALALYGVGAAAAITGGLALFLPGGDVYATGGAGRESAMLEVGGRF